MMSYTNPTTTPYQLPPARKRRRWLRVLLAILIFTAGLVAGVAITIIFAVQIVQSIVRHPENGPARITALLRRKLDLTPDQTPRVQEILTAHQQQIQQARRAIRPQIDTQLDAIRTEVDDVLTPVQRMKWEQLFDQTRSRWIPPIPPPTAPPASPSTSQPAE